MTTATPDFVVVGAGIAGASAAYELAAHGSVVVVEQETTPGYHTTGRSAAVYTEAYETEPVRTLVIASRPHLEDRDGTLSPTPLLSPLPMLYAARDDQLATLDAIAEDVAGTVAVDRLDAAATLDACPALRPGYVAGGLLEPGAMAIDAHALHQGFLAGARRRGARVVTGTRAVPVRSDSRGLIVEAGGERLAPQVLVNAAGAWCDEVAAAAGARPLGLVPYRRTAFTFPPPDDTDISGWPMVVDADEEFYFKPEPGQFMGSLAEETPMHAHDVRPEEIDVALAIERINAATTFGIRHVRRTWAGLRTFSPDRLPVVGFDPEVPGLFWLGGQGGYGIMTSPAMARLAASLIADGGASAELRAAGFDAAAVSPHRFGG